MNLFFIGGADEVGASSSILEINNRRFLIDCGIRMNDHLKRSKTPDFSDIGSIDAILLTHAHTDHSGALPVVNKYTVNVPIYMTRGSFQLCTVLYKDALKIMESEKEDFETPIYQEQDVLNSFENIKQIELLQSFTIDDIQITFFPAGHILGAACILFESKEGSILFTGDYSITKQLAVNGALVNCNPDIIVTEATYGGRKHLKRKESEFEFINQTRKVLSRGGKILIPAFAIGRSQEMIILLKDAMAKNIIPEVDIYIDGMINSVNIVYQNNPIELPKKLKSIVENHQSLFYSTQIKRVLSKERENIIKTKKPCIFISSSGMLIGGPSVFYAKHIIQDKNNALFISGYQDEESPGRKLLELQKGQKLVLDGKNITVNADVYKFSFSAHADEQQIVNFVNTLSPHEIVLVHGDEEARESLSNKFEKKPHLPLLGEMLSFKKYKNTFVSEKKDNTPTITIESYWRDCLYKGIKRVPIKEIEDIFGKNNDIKSFDGFSEDYIDKRFYNILTQDQLNRKRDRREKFESLGDLTKQLVIYGQQTGRLELGYCKEVNMEHLAYHLLSTKKGKSKTQIDFNKILYTFKTNEFKNMKDEDILIKIREMKRISKPKSKIFRKELIAITEDISIKEIYELFKIKEVSDEIAVILALLPIAIKENGKYKIFQKLPPKKLKEKTTNINSIQDEIHKVLKSRKIKKVGYKINTNTFILQFDFPDAVNKEKIFSLVDNLLPKGYSVEISSKINQAAFNDILFQYLGSNGKLSLYLSEKRVSTKNLAKPFSEDFRKEFYRNTGFILE
ncbi:MAG: MBL fold metallo-hydrolase [Clostridiales bacterium]